MQTNPPQSLEATQQQVLLAEKLISLVARAFYNDHVIVLVDILLFEKYIIEEEMAPRLQMTNKDLAKIKNLLERDGLIRFESVVMSDNNKTSWKCYYIDYQHFVNIVRLRIFYMQQLLKQEESSELNEVYYQCPNCGNTYSSLDAQKLIAGDYKFVCSNCFPGADFRSVTKTEEYYRLKQIDNRKAVKTVQSLSKKLDQQLNTHKTSENPNRLTSSKILNQSFQGGNDSKGQEKNEILLHDGIFQLLHELRDVPLPHNLPSENIQRGILASAVTDKKTAEEIAYNLEAAKRGHYGSHVNKKALDKVKLGGSGVTAALNQPKTTFSINILEEGDEPSSSLLNGVDDSRNGCVSVEVAHHSALEASLPEFIQGSRVFRAGEVLQSVNAIQKERDSGSTQQKPLSIKIESIKEEPDVESKAKKARLDDHEVVPPAPPSPSSPPPPPPPADDEEEEDLDDIAWEAEEET